MKLVSVCRALATLVLSASLLVAGGGLAAADTNMGQSGHYGPHMLDDLDVSPGATCVYESTSAHHRLVRVKVKAPYLDQAGAKPQKVGWEARLQRALTEAGPWTTVRTSKRETAIAAAPSTAPLSPRTIVWSSTHPGVYRVIVAMFWYKHGKVNGTARSRVDNYAAGGSLAQPATTTHVCYNFVTVA